MKSSLRRAITPQDRSSVNANVSDLSANAAKVLSDEFLISSNDFDECITELFCRYSRMVRRVAYRILRDPCEADELVQEVFLQMQCKRSEFNVVRGTARGWILQIARNLAISRWRYLKSRQFYKRVPLESVDLSSIDFRGSPNGHARVELQYEKAHLQQLFRLLSENQRRTLELFFCEGYTLDEIAAESGQSKGNVRHYYFRGLEKLRKEVFCKKPQSPAV